MQKKMKINFVPHKKCILKQGKFSRTIKKGKFFSTLIFNSKFFFLEMPVGVCVESP